jgi:sulfate-transporting ATPase
MALVMLACDRIVVLHNGVVMADGSPAEIQNNSEVRNAYLGDAVEAAAIEAGIVDIERETIA